MAKKSARQLRGTDETFLQLMQLSGAGLLKLAGFSPEIADNYEFRAVEFKAMVRTVLTRNSTQAARLRVVAKELNPV